VTRFRKSPSVQADRIKNNAVVMNLVTANCVLLNETAAILWEALDHFDTREELLGMLESAEIPDAVKTFDELAEKLVEAGLIERIPA
jgi:hypothetical protein